MTDTYEFLDYTVTDHIAEIVLNRPPVNAFSIAFLDEILAALHRAAQDETARVVLLHSAVPRIFCAGLDLDILLSKPILDVRAFLEKLYVGLTDAQYNLGKPIIALVNGAARGGGMTLGISCDMMLASEKATFGYPEIDIGVLPAIHFTHLPKIVGRYRAFDLLFTGRTFSAQEAASLGLVSSVVPDELLLEEGRKLARTLASKSPASLRRARAAFMRSNDMGYRSAVAVAVEDFCATAVTPDAQEGLSAFLQKRKPNW